MIKYTNNFSNTLGNKKMILNLIIGKNSNLSVELSKKIVNCILISARNILLNSELYRIETVILRYFNVYGERQSATSDYSGVISIFEKKFKNSEIPNIYGDGEQYRDFVYVKDIAKANIKAMSTPNITGQIFCVGTSQKVSINDLLKVLNKKYSKNTKVNYLPFRQGDIKESICDNSKIKQFLELEKFVKFEEGILKL